MSTCPGKLRPDIPFHGIEVKSWLQQPEILVRTGLDCVIYLLPPSFLILFLELEIGSIPTRNNLFLTRHRKRFASGSITTNFELKIEQGKQTRNNNPERVPIFVIILSKPPQVGMKKN